MMRNLEEDEVELNEAQKEVQEELRMRRHVWRTIPGQPETFLNREHQKRYDILKRVANVMDVMKDRDWVILLKRVSEHEHASNAQQKLF